MTAKFPPRHGDLPRDVLAARASKTREQFGLERCDIYFKFTCEACGERCTFEEPNLLYENGTCGACGHVMPIAFGGYSVLAKMTPQ